MTRYFNLSTIKQINKLTKLTKLTGVACTIVTWTLTGFGSLLAKDSGQRYYDQASRPRPYKVEEVQNIQHKCYEMIQTGVASYYGSPGHLHGGRTSTGERFNMNKISAAHKTLPLPCIVRVVNLRNKRSLKVRVNDRGPFIEGRILDVSRKAAKLLGFFHNGTTIVRIETTVNSPLKTAILSASRPLRPSKLECQEF